MLGREPVLWLAVIRAAVVCAVAFGLSLSAEQTGAIYLVAEALLSVIARQSVTPVESES